MRKISIFLLLLLSPLAGMAFSLYLLEEPKSNLPASQLVLELSELSQQASGIYQNTLQLQSISSSVYTLLQGQQQQFAEQQELIQQLIAKSLEQKNLSHELYEQQLLAKLGPPLDSYQSERVEIMLFELREVNYRGYLAKVKLFDPAAVSVRLGQDEYGKVETTSQAVRRLGAVFGVNGGGFFHALQQGKSVYLPVGNTVSNGQLVGNFSPSRDDLFFSGFSPAGELIGGIFAEKSELMQLSPIAGASFVPILLQDRLPVPIPEKWQSARHPRTILGNFGNGDIFFWVIDGRQPQWSRGATLEEIQLKLLELGAVDAYNLDGGGSSTMVFKGKIINRPSDGQERPVVTNFLIID